MKPNVNLNLQYTQSLNIDRIFNKLKKNYMKTKKIGLMLLVIFSYIQANSQSTYFRSDTNLIKISGATITSEPNSAGTDSVYFQTTDFYSFQGYDTISFTHRITNSSGSLQRIVIQLIDSSGNIKTNLYRFKYSGSSSSTMTMPLLVSTSGSYKVRFSFFRDGGNSNQKFEVSNILIFTPLVALEVKNKPISKKPTLNEDEEPIQIFNFYGKMVFEGGYKDFLKNYAEAGEIYITSNGYKFIKE